MRFEWSNGTGETLCLTGEFIELRPFTRIAHVERLYIPSQMPDTHVETTFTPHGSGTLLTVRMTLINSDTRAAILASGIQVGMEASYRRLDSISASNISI
jgi:uncharacterized protein YndB with AHSA1/START domain